MPDISASELRFVCTESSLGGFCYLCGADVSPEIRCGLRISRSYGNEIHVRLCGPCIDTLQELVAAAGRSLKVHSGVVKATGDEDWK